MKKVAPKKAAKKLPEPVPIKTPRWYMNEKFEYEQNLLSKGKVTAYFKITAGRYGGLRINEEYCKIHENGLMVYVNMTFKKIGVRQSVGTPFKLLNSNKKEFDKALKDVLALLI